MTLCIQSHALHLISTARSQLQPLIHSRASITMLASRHAPAVREECSRLRDLGLLHHGTGAIAVRVVEPLQRVHGLAAAGALERQEGEVAADDGAGEEVGPGEAAAALGLVEVGEGAV